MLRCDELISSLSGLGFTLRQDWYRSTEDGKEWRLYQHAADKHDTFVISVYLNKTSSVRLSVFALTGDEEEVAMTLDVERMTADRWANIVQDLEDFKAEGAERAQRYLEKYGPELEGMYEGWFHEEDDSMA